MKKMYPKKICFCRGTEPSWEWQGLLPCLPDYPALLTQGVGELVEPLEEGVQPQGGVEEREEDSVRETGTLLEQQSESSKDPSKVLYYITLQIALIVQ